MRLVRGIQYATAVALCALVAAEVEDWRAQPPALPPAVNAETATTARDLDTAANRSSAWVETALARPLFSPRPTPGRQRRGQRGSAPPARRHPGDGLRTQRHLCRA